MSPFVNQNLIIYRKKWFLDELFLDLLYLDLNLLKIERVSTNYDMCLIHLEFENQIKVSQHLLSTQQAYPI